MENSKTHELEILITISQNKNVPTCHFQYLFEHKWKIYYPRFKELVSEELFISTSPIIGLPSYELTAKGRSRISDLIEERESEITPGLSRLQNERVSDGAKWKTAIVRLATAFSRRNKLIPQKA